ncbi:hypothetical protein B0O99DRAFT_611420 [Bisporella sp. PMI_857]|nr:hypothetical protein B0O99DRAFT_611420 [Bisporella sp. PMI_857]
MCIEYFNRFTQCHCRISACVEPCSDHLEQRIIALSLNLEAPSSKSCDRYCSREIAGRQIGCCEQSPQGCPVIADAFETALENLEIEEMFDYTSEYLRITVPVWLLRELPFLVDMLWGREGVVGILLRDLVEDSRSGRGGCWRYILILKMTRVMKAQRPKKNHLAKGSMIVMKMRTMKRDNPVVI